MSNSATPLNCSLNASQFGKKGNFFIDALCPAYAKGGGKINRGWVVLSVLFGSPTPGRVRAVGVHRTRGEPDELESTAITVTYYGNDTLPLPRYDAVLAVVSNCTAPRLNCSSCPACEPIRPQSKACVPFLTKACGAQPATPTNASMHACRHCLYVRSAAKHTHRA